MKIPSEVDWSGVRLRFNDLLHRANITVADLSARSGLSQSLLYKMLNHDAPVRPSTLNKLMQALRIDINWLTTGEELYEPDFEALREYWTSSEVKEEQAPYVTSVYPNSVPSSSGRKSEPMPSILAALSALEIHFEIPKGDIAKILLEHKHKRTVYPQKGADMKG